MEMNDIQIVSDSKEVIDLLHNKMRALLTYY